VKFKQIDLIYHLVANKLLNKGKCGPRLEKLKTPDLEGVKVILNLS
jgi:hypothetical protein